MVSSLVQGTVPVPNDSQDILLRMQREAPACGPPKVYHYKDGLRRNSPVLNDLLADAASSCFESEGATVSLLRNLQIWELCWTDLL